MNKLTQEYSGFSLIEIIFSIIIIGMLLITIPTLISGLQNIEKNGLLKEIMVLSTSKTEQLMTYRWDEKGRDNNVTYSRILDIDNKNLQNNELNLSRVPNDSCRKSGLYNREFFSNYKKTPTKYDNLGKEDNIFNDVDDWNNIKYNLNTARKSILSINVYYINDSIKYKSSKKENAIFTINQNLISKESNIKFIKINIKSNIENFFLFVLTSNIGEMEFKKRELK